MPKTRDAAGPAELLQAFEALSSSLDLTRTGDEVLSGLTALLPFREARIFVRDLEGDESLALARRFEPGRGAVSAPRPDPERSAVLRAFEAGRGSLASSGSSLVAPIVGGAGKILGAVVVSGSEPGCYRESDLDTLMSYCHAAAPAVERALLYMQTGSDRRLSGEMEVARQVMSGLLPSEPPELPGFDVAAQLEPAYEVGGDYYDYIPLGDDRHGLAIADVSGKGAPAALLVAALRAALATLASRELALRAIIKHTNAFVLQSTGPRAKYVTLFYAVLDTEARRFLYVNAGHLPPIVMRASGDVELLHSGGFPLGFFENPRYFEQYVQLESGDLLCLYTDGITEATNGNDEEYGRERLVEVLRRTRGQSASDVCRAVLTDVRKFSDCAFADDATVLVMRDVSPEA